MARRAKAGQAAEGSGVSAIRGNGYDPDMVKSFVSRVENVQKEIDAIAEQAKSDCAPHREDMAAIKEEATNAGIPRAELNAVLRKRRLEAKAAAVPAKLNDDQKVNFDQLEFALRDIKDLPLAQAALDKAKAAADRASAPNGSKAAQV